MTEPEYLTIKLKFPNKLSPENNENYKKMLAMSFLKPKGIKCCEENGELIIE